MFTIEVLRRNPIIPGTSEQASLQGPRSLACSDVRDYLVTILEALLNPIPTGHGLNQPIYSYHVTQAGRNRVN